MAFDFDKLKENIISVGKDVGEFAKDTTKLAQLKYDIHTKEDFLQKQYALLGKAFYDAHKDEDVEEKVYFPSIVEAEAELEALKEQLLEAQGAVECPNCGEKISKDDEFCKKCGNSLKS